MLSEKTGVSDSLDSSFSKLEDIRKNSGVADTTGLLDSEISNFISLDPNLSIAIDQAHEYHLHIRENLGLDKLMQGEADLIKDLQEGFVNFYKPATVNEYIAIAAKGPWIITSHGAVVHDNGGYGMLGSGHGPDSVIDAMSKNWVMANVMTPSFSQKRLENSLRKELGHSRDNCPFTHFICMNSGSESVTVSLRIADVNANHLTSQGARHEGKEIKLLAIEQGFHGRTDRPAQGNPGQCVNREFYDEARRLTKEHGSLLLVDSIQAGIRGQGCLSIIDYEGFQDCEVPDLETWSKALNAGQYPLSVLGMNSRASKLYVTGIYGNTMTTNPRALEIASTVLESITPELRKNIKERGVEFLDKLKILEAEFPDYVLKTQGTGLLCSIELKPDILPVIGFDAVEPWCRRRGLGVIHGGENALRFTPHFRITSEEIDLLISIVREAIKNFTET